MNQPRLMSMGLVGALGDMGRLYVRKLAPFYSVHVSDVRQHFDQLQQEYRDVENVTCWPDAVDVARRADYLLLSVPTVCVGSVVQQIANSCKVGAVVGAQTSVKYPEVKAMLQHLPSDVHIVTCHSMHGPQTSPRGQPLVVMRVRCPDESLYQECYQVFNQCFQSKLVELSWEEHDQITADTQAVTHLAFLSMGAAWKSRGIYPWLNTSYAGGIENAKVMTALRIYGSKWHVYAGLAIMNPSARRQVEQYMQSVQCLFSLMIEKKHDEFRKRIEQAARFVFPEKPNQLLLSDDLLEEFSLSCVPKSERTPNTHLSLLAIVDCWHQLGMNPYKHLICQTPPFRLWLGITEYLFHTPELLEASIQTALNNPLLADDLAFLLATQSWGHTILLGSMEGYQKKFEETQVFFVDVLADAKSMSQKMFDKLVQAE